MIKKQKMSDWRFLGVLGMFAVAWASHSLGQAPDAYRGEEATGEDVIALWKFDPQSPALDSSNHGHQLELRGADTHFVEEGKFSGALRIDEEKQPGDVPQGASAGSAPDLSPGGAFTLEMWIQPDERMASRKIAFLLDKKYFMGERVEGHGDYMLLLRRTGSQQPFRLEAGLGFDSDSEVAVSAPFELKAETWYHVAFVYDGHGGCSFFLNGEHLGGKKLEKRTSVHPGKRPLVIGDRIGSAGQRFLGKISEVRISREVTRFTPREAVTLDADESRTAFYRMEKEASLRLKITNKTAWKLKGARARINGEMKAKPVAVPEIEAGESEYLRVPVDAEVKPGEYSVTVEVLDAKEKPLGTPMPVRVTIVPRPLPNRMPTVMAGNGDMEEIKKVGFTHYYAIWQAMRGPVVEFLGPKAILEVRQKLDRAFALQIGAIAQISAGRNPEFKATYNRIDRKGKVYPTLNGLMPEARKAARALGVFTAENFGDLPSLQGAMIDSEMRDHSRPSFHPVDIAAYRAFSGREIPAIVGEPRDVAYKKVPGFPRDRIVPDDDPILDYYRWFWKEGNGWSRIHSLTVEGLKSTGRSDIWTYHQPAVRGPSVYGSGGAVDYLSQWTYTSPDPLRINLAGDELLAMAGGRPGQQIMNMTQVFWYRAQSAPIPQPGEPSVANRAGWEEREPDAKFITISPDHLSETLWLKLSQPVKGIMFHGWESLVGGGRTGYIRTNSETIKRLSSLISEVVEPLAPTLLQVPDAATEVAFLESFASQTFAGRGTFGWGRGWGADAYLVARYAGLQPKIVYDETVIKEGLDGYSVLLAPHCDVVTAKVAAEILKFQQRGGVVVGDEFLAPGIQPDILLASLRRSGDAQSDKAELMLKAGQLRDELDPFYRRPVSSDNPEVVLRRRGTTAEMLFAVNDHRVFGDYVGQYRLVMEKGKPSKAVITWDRAKGVVYDLMKRRIVPTIREEGVLKFSVELDAGEGTLFLALDRPAGKLQIKAPEKVNQGDRAEIAIRLKDDQGQPIRTIVPMQVVIRDAAGREAEQSGYYGADNGELDLALDIASNDAVGKWQVEITEGLSGKQTIREFQVY
ncbi:MAG TPA: LamG domain-containing protein [Chthoniobacteraceae bacterium]|nr:LamG domain-containing protein [Chthoniobacteraceae bacterium]